MWSTFSKRVIFVTENFRNEVKTGFFFFKSTPAIKSFHQRSTNPNVENNAYRIGGIAQKFVRIIKTATQTVLNRPTFSKFHTMPCCFVWCFFFFMVFLLSYLFFCVSLFLYHYKTNWKNWFCDEIDKIRY